MGRPPAHSVDDFLDAAVRLFAAGGARAVTMTALARELDVRSGSVYHRFADRPTLLAATWLRTERRFHQGLTGVLDERADAEGVIAASAWTVDWCRDNLDQAVVLHAGVRAFAPDTWPEPARAELTANQEARTEAARRIVRRVRAETGRGGEEILLALLDLPIAVVNRYLARGTPPPASATALVASIARTIMLD